MILILSLMTIRPQTGALTHSVLSMMVISPPILAVTLPPPEMLNTDDVGRVLSAGDRIVLVSGLSKIEGGEVVEFGSGVKGMALNLESDNVVVLFVRNETAIKEGIFVYPTGTLLGVARLHLVPCTEEIEKEIIERIEKQTGDQIGRASPGDCAGPVPGCD